MNRRRSRCSILALPLALAPALGLTGCSPDMLPPIGQVLLYADTDAPLPPGPSQVLGEDDPPPLFDRLRIDVLDRDGVLACAECTRDFDVDTEMLSETRASMGIVPFGDGPTLVRLRLFRALVAQHGEPRSDSTIDVVAQLPDVGAEGIVEATVFLPTDLSGRVLAPVETIPGAPDPSKVGTWPGAQRVWCPPPLGPGEVCVPGGAFWMGNPRVIGLSDDINADQQRLVVMSPFFIDTTEFTVERFHKIIGSSTLGEMSIKAWSVDDTGDDLEDFCTYSKAPEKQALPLNCLPQLVGTLVCDQRAHQPKPRLPTEAQLEYVASGLGSRLYPWGGDEPGCDDAVWGRAGLPGALYGYASDCLEGAGGVAAPGTTVRDRVRVPRATEDIVDLAGNLREWTRDAWNRQGETCWPAGGILYDPVCPNATPSVDGERVTVKGGSWIDYPDSLRAAARKGFSKSTFLPAIGFRCARAAVQTPHQGLLPPPP